MSKIYRESSLYKAIKQIKEIFLLTLKLNSFWFLSCKNYIFGPGLKEIEKTNEVTEKRWTDFDTEWPSKSWYIIKSINQSTRIALGYMFIS